MLNRFKKNPKVVLSENYSIYRFHVNLNSNHDNYFERIVQTYDLLLHILSEVMQHFHNTIINSKIVVVENAV